MLPGPKDIAEPHKELRFTRSAQGTRFAILAAIALGAGVAMLLLNLIPSHPILPWWYPLLPLPFAAFFLRLATHCLRHAYILLTPLGLEIFPFFNPRRNLQVIYWSQIADAEVDANDRLVIHFNDERNAGIIASLAPMPARHRDLLAVALEGRMQERDAGGEEETTSGSASELGP